MYLLKPAVCARTQSGQVGGDHREELEKEGKRTGLVLGMYQCPANMFVHISFVSEV